MRASSRIDGVARVVAAPRGPAVAANAAPAQVRRASRYGPVKAGRPAPAAAVPDGSSSSGPPTAPAAAHQTTSPMAKPRRPAGCRSAAAYRDSCAPALPRPSRSIPRQRPTTSPDATAAAARQAPAAAAA
ncbi:hypothetical protein LUX33_12880 [Actinomadura madurae]|uniref:hypothetical protein n=1 Tax=Actinomadura madurae TaxID=1993 RepID=UPI0020D248EA|nr:hypothetical protein [Actinomadura madurae]MCP9949212.1 hypothetical protein [Actinomadura madurae]